MNAPGANIIHPDRNRGNADQPRRYQQRNNWGLVPPQGACNNDACTYCGELNHRQGPNCPLWCKHRNERGIPIVRFNENQRQTAPTQNQQNRAPQANVVSVEESQIEAKEDSFRVLHVQCDCSKCIQVESLPENFVTVLAVTRSRKQYVADKTHEDKTMIDPKVWEAQRQVRQGCLK